MAQFSKAFVSASIKWNLSSYLSKPSLSIQLSYCSICLATAIIVHPEVFLKLCDCIRCDQRVKCLIFTHGCVYMWHTFAWHTHTHIHTHTHTHLIHYMRIHIVPVYQLLNDLELAITAGQVETVCIILCTYVWSKQYRSIVLTKTFAVETSTFLSVFHCYVIAQNLPSLTATCKWCLVLC